MSRLTGPDPSNALNEDEHIAELLAKEARDCSVRYSALGSYGSAPKRYTLTFLFVSPHRRSIDILLWV